jgi:hypothetical protein
MNLPEETEKNHKQMSKVGLSLGQDENCVPIYIVIGKGKGKAIPLHAWTGPLGSRRLRLPDLKTIGT